MENKENEINFPKISFVLYSNLKWGSGLEKAAFYYLKYKPEYVKNVTLVQTPLLDKSGFRLNDKDLENIYKNVNIIHIDPVYVKIEKLVAPSPKIFRYLIYYPLLFLLRFTFYRNLYEKTQKPDIIYLFRNDFSFFFKKENFLVGSTHSWQPPKGSISKIINKITGLIFRNKIKVYHSFPIYSDRIKQLFPDKKIISIPNGVETNNFKPVQNKSEKIRFLFVARIEECKGIFRLIDAWMDYKDLENVELNIVGSGSAVDDMLKRISGIKNINYLDRVQENELYEIYGKSDVFVYPSNCDQFPLVILEALSSGLYVITTEKFKDMYQEFEKVNGLYFCSNDKKCFSEGIKYAINNIEIIRSKKELLHNIAKEYYDWKILVKKLYDEMIKVYYEYKQKS